MRSLDIPPGTLPEGTRVRSGLGAPLPPPRGAGAGGVGAGGAQRRSVPLNWQQTTSSVYGVRDWRNTGGLLDSGLKATD